MTQKERWEKLTPRPLILLVGESGSGKSTFANYLSKEWGLKQLESYTTRKPRYEGESGHIFISREQGEYMMIHERIAASTWFDGELYFSTAQQVEDTDIYIVDPAGVSRFLKNYTGSKEPYVIFLDIPEDIRRERMLNRGDSEEDVERRLNHDRYIYEKWHSPESPQDLTIYTKSNLKLMAFELMCYMRFCSWLINRRSR